MTAEQANFYLQGQRYDDALLGRKKTNRILTEVTCWWHVCFFFELGKWTIVEFFFSKKFDADGIFHISHSLAASSADIGLPRKEIPIGWFRRSYRVPSIRRDDELCSFWPGLCWSWWAKICNGNPHFFLLKWFLQNEGKARGGLINQADEEFLFSGRISGGFHSLSGVKLASL